MHALGEKSETLERAKLWLQSFDAPPWAAARAELDACGPNGSIGRAAAAYNGAREGKSGGGRWARTMRKAGAMAETGRERRGGAQEPVVFEVGVSRKKPENIRHKDNPCPFCDVAGLTDIFRREGDRIWLMNKYRTLQRTVQTVVIESANHTGDISTYDRAENRGVFQFAVGCFYQMFADPRFASTVMFKNYGPLSGGSLLHPHLQIVGFERTDAYAHVTADNFGGIEVCRTPDVAVTLSDHPVMGFVEINIGIDAAGLADAAASAGEKHGPARSGSSEDEKGGAPTAWPAADGAAAAKPGTEPRDAPVAGAAPSAGQIRAAGPEGRAAGCAPAAQHLSSRAWDVARGRAVRRDGEPDPALFMPWEPPAAPRPLPAAAARRVDAMADAAHVACRYLLTEHHGGACTSYNLFFYPLGDKLWLKALPRWVTSPYGIGYGITQVNYGPYMEDVRAALAAEMAAYCG